ncbi:L,D-transpeptidase family protein [Polymorphum gilvum]|uniref:ErfK/YbiS/YcfS/YnhG family n=1 Tax=Polymorphum gilvum (strain LMG 25793 / CGMCC 1.9160 / SL003B-26A1) TaxID=991905 RepID=F2IZ28_POLGS|nr:L,D-transpeptidase family protein [Polymorphum gilvum]ADZ71751.1 ErfK/YbiS/YcfS/YnhG family [Polymorphum gilvum SL003B-26A1]
MGNFEVFGGTAAAARLGRRIVVAGCAAMLFAGISVSVQARDAGTGEAPDAPDHTPLQLLVSLKDQKIKVYRGTELLRTSPISSGKPGHGTPTGVFSILEKRRKHFSNLYNNAPMPFMQRLTWSGVALHQGHLPGYPASHGCIRLPKAFAQDLFGMTERGAHVLVTRDEAAPEPIRHAALPQPFVPGTSVASLSHDTIRNDPALRGSIDTTALEPEVAPAAVERPDFGSPLRMIVTPRDGGDTVRTVQRLLDRMGFAPGPVDGVLGRRTREAIRLFQEGAELPITGNLTAGLVSALYREAGMDQPSTGVLRIRRNFKDIYEAPVELVDPLAPIGTHVFTALSFRPGDTSVDWMAVSAEQADGVTPASVLDRVRLSDKVRREVGVMLTPGSSLIVTDRSFARGTGLGTDFVVMTR